MATKMDKALCKELRAELEPMMAAVAEKLGVTLTIGSMKYGGSEVRMPITATPRVVDEAGAVLTPDMVAFTKRAAEFGLDPRDLGEEFESRGEVYHICGLKPDSWKYPILARRLDGKVYKFGAETVAAKLAAARKGKE